ncbi:GNAT family N-acetyltransferase [Staphylospora marina]|uniref:GNAT family N-acetyltransferase n=1 Tax=Staphylospora marina TaxID=2490858 RepID=UPI0013DDB591|nr:N-acetyltransferase [Staphylospora marina]
MTRFEVMKIHPGRGEWVDELVEVLHAAYRVEAALLGVDDFPPLRQGKEQIRRSPDTWMAAVCGSRVAGVISYERNGSVLTITRLAVHPDFFRRGVASSLLEEVLGHPGITRFEVSTGMKNGPAIRCYRKYGFRTKKIWGKDGILLIGLERE